MKAKGRCGEQEAGKDEMLLSLSLSRLLVVRIVGGVGGSATRLPECDGIPGPPPQNHQLAERRSTHIPQRTPARSHTHASENPRTPHPWAWVREQRLSGFQLPQETLPTRKHSWFLQTHNTRTDAPGASKQGFLAISCHTRPHQHRHKPGFRKSRLLLATTLQKCLGL